MKIAIANWSLRQEGGAEVYLDRIIPELVSLNHEVTLWAEINEPSSKKIITIPKNASYLQADSIGLEESLHRLRDWSPEIILLNGGLKDVRNEYRMLEIAPVVFFAHAYYGTCISGSKAHKYPIKRPCHKKFGMTCLFYYYPRRCGGLNPSTGWEEFLRQYHRLKATSYYRTILTASEFMKTEFEKHAIANGRIRKIDLPIYDRMHDSCSPLRDTSIDPVANKGIRLTFIGRMDGLKGVRLLLDSLPIVNSNLRTPVEITLVGDGLTRPSLEQQSKNIVNSLSNVSIKFMGWIKEASAREAVLRQTNLLVVPSVWPEPFGMVGPEAGLLGIPAAGFRVGGIPEWLHDGVNGHLSSGDPPSPKGLAEAIIKCFETPEHYRELCDGAVRVAKRFEIKRHTVSLVKELERAIGDCEVKESKKRTKPLRLLMVSNIENVTYTGMGKWTHRIAEQLFNMGHNPTLWFSEEFDFNPKLRRASVLLFPLYLAWKLVKLHDYFDAVVIHEPSGFWYGILRCIFKFLPPMVIMCHNVESNNFKYMTQATKKGFARITLWMRLRATIVRFWQTNNAIRLADHVLCLSTVDENYIVRRLGKNPNKVTRFVNGVRDDDFISSDNKNPNRVLFIGGWLEVKGRYLLPKIFRMIRMQIPAARLTIVGCYRPDREVIDEFDAQDRHFVDVTQIVTGQNVMRKIYSEHSIFLMPSISEGSPLAVLESMAAGLPVVASKTGGIPDIISDEKDGLLFDLFDVEGAAEKICRVLNSPELSERLAASAKEKARKLHWSQFSSKLMPIIEELMPAFRIRTPKCGSTE